MAVVRLEYKDVKTHWAPYRNEGSHLFNKGDNMLEFIVTWTIGLLILANMLIWGFVIVVVALNILIGIIRSVYDILK
mgnify:CR=1 FL=1